MNAWFGYVPENQEYYVKNIINRHYLRIKVIHFSKEKIYSPKSKYIQKHLWANIPQAMLAVNNFIVNLS